jgi:uncharacterized hydrophobic protein (TIGR00271 family)
MVHLRIIAPTGSAEPALALLRASPTVCNVIHLPGSAHEPDGDVIMCDVARHEVSVIIEDLRELRVPEEGSIAVEMIDTDISAAADSAQEAVDKLPFGDAVIWEDVEARTSEETQLSINFLEFMMIATLIGAVGILLDSPILIVGAMVVGPEFGPIAAFCVALVQRRLDLARRSATALLVGFPIAIAVAFVWSLVFRHTGLAEGPGEVHPFTQFISHPDFFSFFIAYLAGTAGVLSLTSAKSGALIGVLISVTTIPAAANIGVATAYEDWSEVAGAAAQLGVNLVALVLGGVARLYVQHRVYVVRRRRHLQGETRRAAGLPTGDAAAPTSASDASGSIARCDRRADGPRRGGSWGAAP